MSHEMGRSNLATKIQFHHVIDMLFIQIQETKIIE